MQEKVLWFKVSLGCRCHELVALDILPCLTVFLAWSSDIQRDAQTWDKVNRALRQQVILPRPSTYRFKPIAR